MSGKEMRSLSLKIGGAFLPSLSLVTASKESQDCFGKLCHPVNEYCSTFTESCASCANLCDASLQNYHADTCAKECSAYKNYEPFRAEMNKIQSNQHLILLILTILLILIAIRYLVKCLCWLRHKRYIQQLLRRLLSKPHQSNANGKDLNAITIQNPNAFNRDIERAPSQIYSVAGAAEGSVVTMATPVSTRYPAENSTTPTTAITEIGYGYGYDNQAMVVTPVNEKPATTATTVAF